MEKSHKRTNKISQIAIVFEEMSVYNNKKTKGDKNMFVKTAPMGWNTWNTFGQNINEDLIKETADVLVSSGLKDLGYQYLVIDDCWSLKERDENGRLQADPEKFPSGMKALADYVHSKGLKFGMYSCCGTLTCAGYPASYQYEFIDAKTFAEWGVDLLKYDHCFKPTEATSEYLYRRMGLALKNSGRDILFSACSWGINETHKWIKTTGAHMWRTTGDIFDSWESIKELYEKNKAILPYSAPDCFGDMDMLVVGMNGKGNVGLLGCTKEEYRTHYSIWAMFNSPLMIGCDIRSMDEDTKEILMNKEVIAINQDKESTQPYGYGDGNAWIKHLENGDFAVMLTNMGDKEKNMSVNVADVGIDVLSNKKILVRNLWTGEEFYAKNGVILGEKIEAHATRLFRCKVIDG